jgi:hypothetical protein
LDILELPGPHSYFLIQCILSPATAGHISSGLFIAVRAVALETLETLDAVQRDYHFSLRRDKPRGTLQTAACGHD